MTRPVEVEVVLSYSERLPVVDVWLVVDILRASTVMVSWFAAGGGDLYPADSAESAERLAKLLRQEGQTPVLMGERNAIAPPGFDLGNSPLDITRELAQKYTCAVMATTNGTKALLKAASTGTPVLVACARNAFYALDLALSKGSRVGIFCSGRKGRPAWDDTLCAGLLIGRLAEYFPDPGIRLADSARLALLTWQSAGNFAASLRSADHAVFLEKIGFGADIVFAAEADAARAVPELHELPDGEGMRAVLREGLRGETPLVLQGPPASANAPAIAPGYLPAPKTPPPKPEDDLFSRAAEIHAAKAAASHVFLPQGRRPWTRNGRDRGK